MNKVAHYLQEHLTGEVMTSGDARKYFSTDNSIFSVTPSVIVYPKNENDIRKIARFAWQLAERGRIIPITARGNGTDLSGAAIGSGILMVLPAHLNRLLSWDDKEGLVTAEAGMNYGKLQQVLMTHGRFLPSAPASLEYSTIGGAVANNAGGIRSLKYGDTRAYVKGLRVVLSNGEIIETERLSKRDLNRKLGLASFEGEIYRSLDALLEENKEIVAKSVLNVTRNAAGYALADVKAKDGTFDLTPLLVGSQGTLGLVTETTLESVPFNAKRILTVAYLEELKDLQSAIIELRNLPDMPSAMELVDINLLNFVTDLNANLFNGILNRPYPKYVLLIEFDNANEHKMKKLLRKADKILAKYAKEHFSETDEAKQHEYWKLREASALLLAHNQGQLNPVPLIDDGIVPVDLLSQFIQSIYDLFGREHLDVAVWGHAGDGNLHIRPFLNLGQIGDRQKAFRMLDEFSRQICSMGGSTSGQYNDGRLRGPYLSQLYSEEVYQLFVKVKKIFDPYNILNPGVKLNVSLEEVKPLVRNSYGMTHIYDHLPLS